MDAISGIKLLYIAIILIYIREDIQMRDPMNISNVVKHVNHIERCERNRTVEKSWGCI